MRIIPNLHFNGDCEKAIQAYEQAFDAKRTVFLRNVDVSPSEVNNDSNDENRTYVYHAEMMIGDQRVMMNDDIHEEDCGNNVSLLISFNCIDSLQHAYEMLHIDAKILSTISDTSYSSCFVSLVDRFGIRWELMMED